MSSDPIIVFVNVGVRLGDDQIYDRLSFDVRRGEFVCILGPSGCGKSTALRIIAGLEAPTAGTVRIGDVVVNDLEPRDRDVAMVFQSYALYPHMTVARNIEFPLRARRVPADELRSLRSWDPRGWFLRAR